METLPTDIKKEKLIALLTPSQRVALAMTSKKQNQWVRPLLGFMNMSFPQKITYLKTSYRGEVPDDLILEAVAKQHDPQILISLLESLPDRMVLKKKLRQLVEDRIRDRGYRKLLKKTLLQSYLQHLLREHRSIPRFINTIKSPEVQSFAIEQYLLLKKKEFSPMTIKKWVQKIPDEYTRAKTARTLRI